MPELGYIVKRVSIHILRCFLRNNILHYLEEIGHHNRIRMLNPPAPPTWISMSVHVEQIEDQRGTYFRAVFIPYQ